jgi:hypothetical protein
MGTPASRTTAAIAARRRASTAKLQRVTEAVTRLQRRENPVTIQTVARQAGVSRTFLYANTHARAIVEAAIRQTGRDHAHQHETQHAQAEASWRERARNAEEALKVAHQEIRTQRDRIATLLGQIRDLETQWTAEQLQRITTDNANLKDRVRQLTNDNRTLNERLAAARSNSRFQDRRVSQLEAQLLQPHTQR